jgi:hypothetical protein
MQLVGVALLLISIGTILAPIGAVVVIYRDNLPNLVIPVELSSEDNLLSPIIGDFGGFGDVNVTDNLTTDHDSLLAPVFVDAQIDAADRSFTITVNFTNTFSFNLTLNSLSAGVICHEHNYLLGNVSVNGPITIRSDETSQIYITGSWTQDAENHVSTMHEGQTSINVDLIDLTIDVNGINVHNKEPINIGGVALSVDQQ